MNYKVPGLSSIILVFAALLIACCQLFLSSPVLALIYFICIPLAFLFTLYNYCTKCPHVQDGTCRHVVFGWVVVKLFKIRSPSKYTLKEIILALAPIAALLIFPQYWLFQNIGLFTVFWVLMLIAVVIVRTGVCISCRNSNCKFCPNK